MIKNAILRAYQTGVERDWDKIYWAIDLHGVCFKSNYKNGEYEFVNEDAVKTLRLLSSFPESVLILWSSCHDQEKAQIMKFFSDHDIDIAYFNSNPEVENTATGCFDSKFYFSILLDDKAGFDPETDWKEIYEFFNHVASMPTCYSF